MNAYPTLQLFFLLNKFNLKLNINIYNFIIKIYKIIT